MIVVRHETERVANPVIPLVDLPEDVQEALPVMVVLEDWLFLVSPGSDVIHCAGVFYAERAGHGLP
jgi:hypothetical protein